MTPLSQFGLQFALSTVFFALVAMWYIMPALNRRSMEAALVPLFLAQTTRYIPLSGLAPGQVGPDIAIDAIGQVGYNGLASALLAVGAALFLRYRWPAAIPIAWVVNTVTLIEGAYASYIALSNRFVDHALHVNWFIIGYWLPVIAVLHLVTYARLARK